MAKVPFANSIAVADGSIRFWFSGAISARLLLELLVPDFRILNPNTSHKHCICGISCKTPKLYRTLYRDDLERILPAIGYMELLADYHRWYKEEKFKWGDKWEDNNYLFPRENRAPMLPGYVCNWLADFNKRHGLPHINPHAFRHTQENMLFLDGIDSVSISHCLGHAHVSTTTDIYGHVIKEAEERISDRVVYVILKPSKAKLRVVGDWEE